MAEYFTIEAADEADPIDPALLRDLKDLLRNDDGFDLGVSLKDRPPAPGEQGAIVVALEIIAVVTPLGRSFAGVLKHWVDKHKLSVKVSREGDDYSVQLSGGHSHDVERLIEMLEKGKGAEHRNGD